MTSTNIMTSRTFGQATDNMEDLREAVRSHAQAGAEKVRRQQSVAQAIMVFLSTPRFRSDLPQDYPALPYHCRCQQMIAG
jgi:DNA polymerase V|tara:strand:- start:288 stop:527 length:240 start_codon:yes stop_codon:yes gene_type:complete